MELKYESDYHNSLHKYLINNKKYYLIKSRLALRKYLNGVKDLKILEFGCGLGQNIYLLKNAYGYDISQFSLKFCKKNGIKVANNLDKLPNDFDVILISHCLEHLNNPFETLKILNKKLKKGGKLILVLPAEKHEKNVLNKMDKSEHLFAWTFRTINHLLMNTNFKPIENKYLYGTGYNKLLKISDINFELYFFLTQLLSRLINSKEMKITAVKQ
jgi:SAM-dependent methyltransferase